MHSDDSPTTPPPPSRWHLAAVLVANARLGRGMVLGGAIYGLLATLHLPLPPCPWLSVTGLPCPGCGMTHGVFALLRGDWLGSVRANALAWVLLVFWTVVSAALMVPARHRPAVAAAIGRFEQRTKWALWFGLTLLVYTLTRWMAIWYC
ncbi:MAG: DUF2752 domain-containing protein [Verrucomicrobia bacterium]|nr:DUF2752 domain-containing protein [Verrucomicrobiota bacterium]